MEPQEFPRTELISENLEEIISNFRRCQDSWEMFKKRYPEWRHTRKINIEKLNEIAGDLKDIKLYCNVSKVVSSSVGAVGGVLSIVGAGLIPITAGLSTPLLVGGIATSSVGGCASFGTTVTEVALLKRKVTAAQTLLKVEEKDFLCITEWFQHANSLASSIKKFLDIETFDKSVVDFQRPFSKDLNDSPFSTIMKVVSWFCHHLQSEQSVIVKELPKHLPFLPEQFIAFLVSIISNPGLFVILKEVAELYSKNPIIFEAALMTTKICFQVLRGVDVGADVWSAVTSTIKIGSVSLGGSASKAVSQGLFAGFALAVDVTSLVLTSIDLYDGSKCPTAEKIQEITKQLTEELGITAAVYAAFEHSVTTKQIGVMPYASLCENEIILMF